MTSSELKSIAEEINALHAEFKQLVSELQEFLILKKLKKEDEDDKSQY